jgi:hypothetical protein
MGESLRYFAVTPLSKPCFYTAGLNDDIEKMVDSAKFGLTYTPYLKVRWNCFFDMLLVASVLSRLVVALSVAAVILYGFWPYAVLRPDQA